MVEQDTSIPLLLDRRRNEFASPVGRKLGFESGVGAKYLDRLFVSQCFP